MSVLLKVLTGLVSLAVMGAVSVTDPTGDAVGDGTIVAPTAPRYANSAIFDLQDVSIEVLQDASGGSIILLPAEPDAAEDGAEVGPSDGDIDAPAATSSVVLADVRSVLKVTLGAIDVSESTALGFGSVVIDLYLDGAPGGRETTLDGPGMLMPAGRGWEYAVRLTPDGATGFRYVAPPVAALADDLVVEPAEDASVEGETEVIEL